MSLAIVVNGRCLHRPVTGVERYTTEMLACLADRVRVVARPRPAGGIGGHLWEQVRLPLLVGRHELLWSPANTGPLAVSRQVVTVHDVSPLDHPEWFHPGFAAWYRLLLPALARRVRRIITDSSFSRARILERLRLAEERVASIPCGVGPQFAPAPAEAIAAVRRRYDLPAPYLMTVGSLQPRKNLATLFTAFALVRREASDVDLAVAGTSRATFGSPAVGRVPPGVALLGFVDDEDLPALYSGAAAVVVPSLYEGFGLTVLEAMACGAPVVVASGTALDDVAGDAALKVDARSAEALAEGLTQVLSDSTLRSTLRRHGLARARQFPWERAAEAAWRVLQEAADD